jgi:YidC/Oxa1 family membrane protein insertase
VRTAAALLAALGQTEPGQQIRLTIKRSEAEKQLNATLAHQPLDLIRAEWETKAAPIVLPGKHDPLSFLTTIQQFDDRTLANDDKELGGVNLRDGAWEVVEADELKVSFRRVLPRLRLEITKTYRLSTVPQDEHSNPNYPAYGVILDLRIANVDDKPHKVAYRLDGPTGLPIEGAWFASKVSHNWGGAGLRDVIVQFDGGALKQVSPGQLADPDNNLSWGATSSLDYIAVDAQYFASAILPRKKSPDDIWFQSSMPRRAGAVPTEKAHIRLMNVSFRLDSKLVDLAPGGPPLEHQFEIFAGPKRPALLAHYSQPGGSSLKDLVYYGWFGVVARPMLVILQFFHSLVGNFGLAIIMLTVLVRGCMFPLSRKQALGAQKMQELQPEMKRIAEKYKTEPEKRTKATQELFRSHNYNPVGGCMLAFVQLPVFVGLYRSLMVSVDLRQAPLFSESIRWASNLAAPDMLWNWTGVMPEFITSGTGILGLGPYLNVLPLITIALFIWQQKMFMPPAADEQARLQQKMMQYMMIFMGVLFFKVASGLCLYFIASSLWGVCERKLLPKAASKGTPGGSSGAPVPAASPTTSGNGAPSSKKRQRGPK